MSFLDLSYNLVFILGILNLVFLFFVVLTCRCIMPRFLRKFSSLKLGGKLYNFHSYFMTGFIFSVFFHSILAFFLYYF